MKYSRNVLLGSGLLLLSALIAIVFPLRDSIKTIVLLVILASIGVVTLFSDRMKPNQYRNVLKNIALGTILLFVSLLLALKIWMAFR